MLCRVSKPARLVRYIESCSSSHLSLSFFLSNLYNPTPNETTSKTKFKEKQKRTSHSLAPLQSMRKIKVHLPAQNPTPKAKPMPSLLPPPLFSRYIYLQTLFPMLLCYSPTTMYELLLISISPFSLACPPSPPLSFLLWVNPIYLCSPKRFPRAKMIIPW